MGLLWMVEQDNDNNIACIVISYDRASLNNTSSCISRIWKVICSVFIIIFRLTHRKVCSYLGNFSLIMHIQQQQQQQQKVLVEIYQIQMKNTASCCVWENIWRLFVEHDKFSLAYIWHLMAYILFMFHFFISLNKYKLV